MQSVILTEVSDCRLLIVVTSPFFFVFFWCVRVCVSVRLCMYVRAYLAVPCVSAHDHVKHTKPNNDIRYDNQINQ